MAQAQAHAFLDHANPPVGSTVHAAPAEVSLWFTQEIEPAFSRAQVLNAGGERVDRGDQPPDRSDLTQLRVSLPALTPGVYKVVWRVVSVDSHVTEGDFTFRYTP